ncbi:hypothetical protein [Streptomyces sp. NPDC090053]|uniref:hypothetical protein n=1 Tax=Streptomyces sp. NPDC090053 TaxID=3365932 RepID=UPI00381236A7
MLLQQQLKALLRDSSEGAERHDARILQMSRRKFASFAYVAEQYGYVYDGLSPISPAGSPNPYFAFRRASDAVERASRAAAQHPDVLRGGPLPGMRPGSDRLRPLPATQPSVDLLHARIEIDYSSTQKRRGLIPLLLIPIVMLAFLTQLGFSAKSLTICVVIWLLFAALWVLGVTLARRRTAKYSRMIELAGALRQPWRTGD